MVKWHSNTLIAGEITVRSPYNPNGSNYAIEGIISKNGQILGKMGHSERYEESLQNIAAISTRYFKNANQLFQTQQIIK